MKSFTIISFVDIRLASSQTSVISCATQLSRVPYCTVKVCQQLRPITMSMNGSRWTNAHCICGLLEDGLRGG